MEASLGYVLSAVRSEPEAMPAFASGEAGANRHVMIDSKINPLCKQHKKLQAEPPLLSAPESVSRSYVQATTHSFQFPHLSIRQSILSFVLTTTRGQYHIPSTHQHQFKSNTVPLTPACKQYVLLRRSLLWFRRWLPPQEGQQAQEKEEGDLVW